MNDLHFRKCAVSLRTVTIACALVAAISLPVAAAAQQTPPRDLVRMALQNEMNDDSHFHLFTWKERKKRDHDTQMEQLVATPNGIVSRVMLIDDKPLNSTQQAEERERIRKMLDPAQMSRKQREQREDDERTHKMLANMADAFDFTTLDTATAPNGHKLTKIKFTARPGYNPPDRESMVFTGMQGEMLVDETANRLAKIDGTLFKDVNFGWGILGKLYRGGRFYVEQSEVAPSHWDTTKMILHFDGKALFIKPIHIDENESAWDFQPVAPMSVAQALDFLSHEAPAQNAMLRR